VSEATEQPWRSLRFEEAARFFASKVPLTKEQFDALVGGARARAFTVSGLASKALVQDVLEAINAAISDGTTIDQFRKDIRGIIQAKGWTGEKDWRVQTIFRTNIQGAFQAGKWAQAQASEGLQVVVYDAVADGRTRPSHLALDGRAFLKSDPIWDTWWPPNGFNCRCTVRLMSMAEAKARGVRIESGEGILRGEAQPVGPGRDLVLLPDPGFDTNPAKDFAGVKP
jgi:SPP1 gp7 family putative phage head morphogenesis protein